MTALKADNLACSIGRRVIVSGIDLDVQPGTMTALVGVNGVGKSTLMRVLAGIRPATTGHVEIDGRDLSRLRPRERARLMAFVAQEEAAPEDLSLSEMVALGHLADRRCGHLSGGERRRAMLAKGLAQGTDLLLLDEPTNHLDVHHQLHLLQTMRATGRTIVASIHDLDLAMGWFDRIVMLADGGIHAAGTPEEVMTAVNLESAFKVRARQVPAVGDGVQHLIIDGLVPPEPIDPEP